MEARYTFDHVAQDNSDMADLDPAPVKAPAIRFLVESALETVTQSDAEAGTSGRDGWIAQLGEAVMAPSDSAHQAVVSSLMAQGAQSCDLYQHYIPEASRYIGAKWVSDEASFVDVTTGAARLQALFRDRPDASFPMGSSDQRNPEGHSMLMVIPDFEQHSLGAFVAADYLQRQGVWTRMAIGLSEAELGALLTSSRFALIGISLATQKSVDAATDMIQRLRNRAERLPPIVVGGRIVDDQSEITECTKADYVVKSPHEVLRLCYNSAKARLRTFEQAG